MQKEKDIEPKSTVQSLERALVLLDKLAEKSESCSIKELSELTKLNKSTIHRLLHTLMSYDYVRQDTVSERYYLGYKPLILSGTILEKLDVREVARPHLKELCNISGKTAHMFVRNGAYAVYVEKLENPDLSIRMYSQIGKRIPLYCSAGGKALLAWMNEEDIKQIVGELPMVQHTKNTITDISKLLEELERVRNQGYAVDWYEHEDNVFCIAAPVFRNTNVPIASIGIAGTVLDIGNPSSFLDCCKYVNNAARQISIEIGCAHYPTTI